MGLAIGRSTRHEQDECSKYEELTCRVLLIEDGLDDQQLVANVQRMAGAAAGPRSRRRVWGIIPIERCIGAADSNDVPFFGVRTTANLTGGIRFWRSVNAHLENSARQHEDRQKAGCTFC